MVKTPKPNVGKERAARARCFSCVCLCRDRSHRSPVSLLPLQSRLVLLRSPIAAATMSCLVSARAPPLAVRLLLLPFLQASLSVPPQTLVGASRTDRCMYHLFCTFDARCAACMQAPRAGQIQDKISEIRNSYTAPDLSCLFPVLPVDLSTSWQ